MKIGTLQQPINSDLGAGNGSRRAKVWPPAPAAYPRPYDPNPGRLLTKYSFVDFQIGFALTFVLTFVFGLGILFALIVNVKMQHYKDLKSGVNDCLMLFATLLLFAVVLLLGAFALCSYIFRRLGSKVARVASNRSEPRR